MKFSHVLASHESSCLIAALISQVTRCRVSVKPGECHRSSPPVIIHQPISQNLNCTIKTMIAYHIGDQHISWDQWIREFWLAINTAKHESTGRTPAELAFGRTLKGPKKEVDQPASLTSTGSLLTPREATKDNRSGKEESGD